MGHSINKGYFSGKYILRIWGRDGKTLHNSAHDTSKQARDELVKYQSEKWPRNIDVHKIINDLPRISVEQGFARRTGHAMSDEEAAAIPPQGGRR